MAPEQFESFYNVVAPKAYALALLVASSDSRAQDVVQESFVNPVTVDIGTEPIRGIEASLMRAVRRASCERLACTVRAGPLHVHAELCDELAQDVCVVTEPGYFRGLKVREIAACLALPAGEVCSKLLVGMRRLRDAT